jgi:hypothetical protein
MTDPSTIRTVEYGDASDLPEINWLWRRVFIFLLTVWCAFHLWLTVRRIDDIGTLREVVRGDQLLIALLALLYIAGASTEAITRLVGAVRTSRKETIAEASPPTSIASHGTTITSTPAPTPAPPPVLPDRPPWERHA